MNSKVVFVVTLQFRGKDGKRRVYERFEGDDRQALLNRVFVFLEHPDFSATIARKR